jgi:excisionase family DNA binding protein
MQQSEMTQVIPAREARTPAARRRVGGEDSATGAGPLLTVEQVARLVGVSRSTAYAYLAAQIIPCRRVGNHFVIHRAEVEDWLRHGRRPGAEVPQTPVPSATIDLGSDLEIVITVRRRDDKPPERRDR